MERLLVVPKDARPVVVEQAWSHVRRGHDVIEPERVEPPKDGLRLLGVPRAVVDSGDPMTVEVDEALHASMLPAMSAPGEQVRALDQHRVIVCVGAGGVGKTTVAASVALAAAERGRRTLCLTIDPARRLAGALGLSSFSSEEVPVEAGWLAAHGVHLSAPLEVMMLDAKRTFDALVLQNCRTQAEADVILGSRVYHHVSSHLAGTRAYMAMEKVLLEMSSERFDLIVLDTPPSARALDFFDAPAKMIDILDSPATRALVRAMGGGRLSLDLLALGLKTALSAFDKIVGSSFLEEMAALLSAMNGLFGGFEKRAREVGARMRGDEFAYLLVASPSLPAVLDASSLGDAMLERKLSIHRCVANRMSPRAPLGVSAEQLAGSGLFAELGLSRDCLGAILESARDCALDRALEEQRVAELVARVPAIAGAPVLLESSPLLLHRPDRLLGLGRQVLTAR